MALSPRDLITHSKAELARREQASADVATGSFVRITDSGVIKAFGEEIAIVDARPGNDVRIRSISNNEATRVLKLSQVKPCLAIGDHVVTGDTVGTIGPVVNASGGIVTWTDVVGQHPAWRAGGGPFATYMDQTTKGAEIGGSSQALGGIHGDLVEAMREIVTDSDASGRRYRLNGWALDSILEPTLWGATDTTGRPLYVELPTDSSSDGLSTAGRLLNRPSFIGEGVATANQTSVVGYGGDFGQAAWGVVGGISYRVSTEAAVTINGTLTSLFEHNLVAILAEAEYGFLLNDPDAFVKLTNNSGS